MTIVENQKMNDLMRQQAPLVFAMWHGNELAMIAFAKHYKVATLTSQSKDGELMDFVLRKMGFQTSRGSSTRGGVSALKGLVRISKTGYVPMFPVDGPKGPIYVPKPGVFELSRLTQAHILPGGVAASSSYVFKKSWNKAFLPLPFSKVVLAWTDPISPVTKDMDPRSEELSLRLKKALDASGQRAQENLA